MHKSAGSSAPDSKAKAASTKRKQPAAAKSTPAACLQGLYPAAANDHTATGTKRTIMPLLGCGKGKLAAAAQQKSAVGKSLLRNHDHTSSVAEVKVQIEQSIGGVLAASDKAFKKAEGVIDQLAEQIEGKVQTHHAGASEILQESEAAMRMANEQHTEAVQEVNAAQSGMLKLVDKTLCQRRVLADIQNTISTGLQNLSKKYKVAV
jgi:phage-related protein